jgi:PAS domain S-box-containing protein
VDILNEADKKRNYKILIVDDSQTNIDYLTSILKQDNFSIATSSNGANAITKAKGNRFDLILLDVIMEGIDGFEVCKELKNYPATKDVPIIFLTGLTNSEHITKGFEYGAVDFVKKPYNHSELKARVNTHLELKRSKDDIARKNKLLEDTNAELEKLSIVASKTSNSVMITNPVGEIEWVNEGFTRLTGYTIEEYKAVTGSNFINCFENKNLVEDIRMAVIRKKPIVFSTVKMTKAGKGIWVQTTLTPILDCDGDLKNLVAIAKYSATRNR